MIMTLSAGTLSQLPPEVSVPNYDRGAVQPWIAHLGVGGFHRAHQAVYTDDLLRRGLDRWGICGVGITAADRRMQEALAQQDWLYTLVAASAEGLDVRVIGSMVRYLVAREDTRPVIERLAGEETRLVSLTVTENGYHHDPQTGELNLLVPEVAHDLDHPNEPQTVVGTLAAMLVWRFRGGRRPVTILSCDNLPGNGAILRGLVLGFLAEARLPEADYGARGWVEEAVPFPNTMVDRITPFTTEDRRRSLEQQYGVRDNWPVFCEDFRQWVIEDRFATGRPPWEEAGAQFVPDVHPYELMKIRLLNGSHSALAYLAYLLGHRDVDRAMADPDLRCFLRERYMEEVTPTLQPVPGIDLDAYKDGLVRRFANPAIRDQVTRLAMDGSKKVPNMIVKPLAETLRAGRPFGAMALALAGWIRFLAGTDEEGKAVVVEDPLAESLMAAARRGGRDPRPFLALREIFGEEVPRARALVEALAGYLERLHAEGARRTLQGFLAGE